MPAVKIPVHIVGGFLGSGKTTLMNRCLKTLPADQRVALIVNDFGKVPVDGTLIDRGDYAMKELPAGCVCCTLSGALMDAIAGIVEDQQPDVIVMETTGIAKPAQIALLLGADLLKQNVHIGNILCLVDSSTFPRMEQHLHILREQVEQSNTVVLNKTDLADPDVLDLTRRRVEYLAQPGAEVVETTHGEVPPDLLFEVRTVYLPEETGAAHDHTHAFMAHTVDRPDTYSLDRLIQFVRGLGDNVLRVKGIVRTDQGARLIQGSLAGIDVTEWTPAPDESRLVFIGQEFETDAIDSALADCRIDSEAH